MEKEKRDRVATEELTRLTMELSSRKEAGHGLAFRMRAWNATIWFSYKLKRFIDLVVSFCALIVLFPLLLLIGILIKLTSPGAMIFTQIRVGRYGRYFRFYKFRTMYIDAEERKAQLLEQNQSADGVIFKMKNDPRVTPIGRILRKTSLDELPQLVNVFLGDMSLVGPRPPVPQEVREYTLEDRKRLNVIPGLTCIWQISGRSDIPFSGQVKLDKEYIVSRGFWRDIWILLKTIPAIFIGKGAY
ncbi:MAG: sugar transferase [Victivallales bacterium]|nr:sugar transferase [Victivallales bacterium]